MGCDIHLYVERREAGFWRSADTWIEEDGRTDVPYGKSFYDGRNYDLFAILADVRNGRGFAGVKTGRGFVPIASPRGLPEDASPEVAALSASWDVDGHSHSFHTLRDLLNFDWTQTTGKQGWTNLEAWMRWIPYARRRGEGPESYAGDVMGGRIVKIEASAMDAIALNGCQLGRGSQALADFMRGHEGKHALAVWETPYSSAARDFLATTLPRLLALAGGTQGLDDVRIVFWFDN